MKDKLDGDWELIAYQHRSDEIEYDDSDEGPRSDEIQAWLLGAETTPASLQAVPPRTGVQLMVHNGAFRETVEDFSELMFDVAGVQVNDYQPMSGTLVIIGEGAFLVPAGVPDYATQEPAHGMVVRYDDGDTKVCDALRIVDGMLVRQTSVVTDEIYLDRMLLVYRRSEDGHAEL